MGMGSASSADNVMSSHGGGARIPHLIAPPAVLSRSLSLLLPSSGNVPYARHARRRGLSRPQSLSPLGDRQQQQWQRDIHGNATFQSSISNQSFDHSVSQGSAAAAALLEEKRRKYELSSSKTEEQMEIYRRDQEEARRKRSGKWLLSQSDLSRAP